MKLVAASTALFAAIQAQSIETLIGELVNKIYQTSDDGLTHTINIAPYYQATYELQESGFEGEGTFGNGNGVIEFTESGNWASEQLTYQFSASGAAKSHPFAAYFPAEVLDDTFEAESVISAGANGISWKEEGKTNGVEFLQSVELNVDSVSMSSKKFIAELSLSRESVMPSGIHEFWRSMAMPVGTTEVQMSANAKRDCMDVGPMDRACSAKVTITGSNNDEDFGSLVAKYSVNSKKAQLTVTHDKNEIFWLGLVGIDTLDVLALKYKLNGGKAVLIVQFVGPEGIGAVAAAGEQFIQPFIAFFGSLLSGDDAAHAAAYMDKVFAHIQGQNYFNVYPIVKATQFESELLANAIGVKSMQKGAKDVFGAVNYSIEEFAATSAPVVSDARDYVNTITGPSGEAQFDAWFAALSDE